MIFDMARVRDLRCEIYWMLKRREGKRGFNLNIKREEEVDTL